MVLKEGGKKTRMALNVPVIGAGHRGGTARLRSTSPASRVFSVDEHGLQVPLRRGLDELAEARGQVFE